MKDEQGAVEASAVPSPSTAAQPRLPAIQPAQRGGDHGALATASYQAFDRALHAGMGRMTGGLAPSALLGGFLL